MPLTAAQLLALIAGALLLQAAAGAAWAGWRWRRKTRAAAEQRRSLPPRPEPANAAWRGLRAFRVVGRQFEDPAQTQCSFHLAPVDGQPLAPFAPGQFLTFALDVAPAGDDGAAERRTITRCYSLSDRPESARMRVTIKRVPAPAEPAGLPPGVSSNHFHDAVQVGDVLQVRAPAGHFHIDSDAGVPAVLVGGGIGITPMMSMLRWCLAEQPQRTLHLYYGVRNGREHAFKTTLEALAAQHPQLQLHVVYSRPDAGDVQGRDYQHRGHVDIELLRRTLPHGRHRFFVCGPPSMMQTLVPALAEWGVAPADLHFEAFGPASVQLPSAAGAAVPSGESFEVRFERSGRTLAWDGTEASLLAFAERHGVEAESGCRSGSCGACETRVLEGEVAYDQPPDHEPAPGHCLMCVGRPTSALVLEA